MTKEHFLWVERYRPKSVADTILPAELKRVFQTFVEQEMIPNLLLAGGPGMGKTTVAKAMCNQLKADYIVINGSMKGNIDTLRNEILNFASTMSLFGGRKYVILDEADYLNDKSTQPALRNFMEEFSTNCLSGDTKIPTLNFGVCCISELVGREVVIKCKDGIWRPALVKNYGKQRIYSYKFAKHNSRNGEYFNEVKATSNHHWFLKNGIETDELQKGDILELPKSIEEEDIDGLVHGLIFGDGSVRTRSVPQYIDVQGKEYASIRVCKQDRVKEEICSILEKAGAYKSSYSPDGDPVYHIKRKLGLKRLPHTLDPSYIAGFIKGWWLADGKKDGRKDRYIICTIQEEVIKWLKTHASIAGYIVTGLSVSNPKEGYGYVNGKPLYYITLRKDAELCVRDIEYCGEEEVFCLEEPITHSFVLANGLLTGNCGFILTANYANKIIDPLQSRCSVVDFKFLKKDIPDIASQFFKRVRMILECEGVDFEKQVVAQVINQHFPDFRRIINDLQRYSARGMIDSGILAHITGADITPLISLIKQKNFTEARAWITHNVDNSDAFFDALSRSNIKPSTAPALILLLAKYQDMDSRVANKEINLAACVAEIMLEELFD